MGVNFSKEGLESIKIYYNWVHPLTPAEVKGLLFSGNTDSYYHSLEALNENHFKPSLDFAYGVTFAIKVDKHMKTSVAHFTMPDLEDNDIFFEHPLVKQYYAAYTELPVEKRKGVFHHTDEKGNEHTKDYYYVHHPALKELINKDYNIDIQIAPIIEWAMGKGFYTGADSSDEKIDLLLNYSEVFKRYGLDPEWPEMEKFTKTMFYKYKLNAYCPGFYKNKKIRSMYYFDIENVRNFKMDSIPKLIRHK